GGAPAGRRGAPGADPRAAAAGSAEPLLGLFAPRDGLVARSPADHARPARSRASAAGDARRELLVAAAELALLSAALYALAGVGASYFV
ncbi:MAG: hypothetical protein JNG85_15630, partial [Spirochaetaceae bacterium]|nr:hypothetical protein [Spirochaetaceae bacterium]